MRSALCLALLMLATSLPAADEIYRWVDAEGVIHYGSRPPSKDARPAALPALQTYKSAAAPVISAAPSPSPQAPSGPAALELRVTAPVEGETFRDAQGIVPVSVAATPGLPPGAGFVFYLDGVAKNKKPWAAPGYTFTEVERGEHSVSVAVVSAEGSELQRAAVVRFFQMPPIAPQPVPKKAR